MKFVANAYACWMAVAIAAAGLNTAAYQITLFPASRVYDRNPAVLDANLGFPAQNLLVEVFEEEQLAPQVKANLTGHSPSDTQAEAAAWDGQWASTPTSSDTIFAIQISSVRAFGVGIGNNASGGQEELSINNGRAIRLSDLAGYVASAEGRGFYLKVQAEPNEVDLLNIRLSKGPGMRLDHLVLQRDEAAGKRPEPMAEPQQLRAEAVTETPAVADFEEGRSASDPSGIAESASGNRGIDLLSRAGRKYVGSQARFFFVDPDGVLSSPKPQWISLHHTEGRPFRLHGQVWLGGMYDKMLFPDDLPDGFALFIREWDGLHRYALTSRGTDVKRRLANGVTAMDTVAINRFEQPTLRQWLPFHVEVNWNEIVFVFAGRRSVVEGPLDMDGANKIAIAPGTKLRQLRLELFEGP